jgi:integrase
MTLQDYLTRYNQQRDIRPSTLEHYTWVARSLQSFAGNVRTSQLTDDLLNRWLLHLRDVGLSPFTVHSRRNALLVIWRAAWRDGLAPQPGEVRRIRLPDPAKDIWTADELHRLLDACEVLTGSFRGLRLSRAAYMQTLIRAAYDTGLRRGDLHRVTTASVLAGERLGINQQKTGRSVVVRLHASTLELVREFARAPEREYVWPRWSKRRGTFARTFKRVTHAAGLVGDFGTLRKTSGTEVERLERGAGWLHLGHSNPETARRWYLNAERAYDVDRPLPPPL